LRRLLLEVGDDATGGLLAVPLADTLKRADAKRRVTDTPSRDGLWQAQTPQMFRYGLLLEALRQEGAAGTTDEAQAIERLGASPLLVEGSRSNIKVTYASDLPVAEAILKARSKTKGKG
jgi:2-C-methyl-D-erythritol 4-phosphate cytidylyltransferase